VPHPPIESGSPPLGKDPESAWPDLSELQAAESAELDADAALTAEHAPLPAAALFQFYDHLRERILHAVQDRAGRWSEVAVEALLLAPDIFILLVRLALDREVPASARALIGGTLAYFVMPADLLPELLLGPVGFMDDLVLASAVLSQAFGGELEPYAERHWSGSHELRKALHRVVETAQSTLGDKLYRRLKRLLARRGVALGKDE
jgi:uncharacterized membrane protein YkvA (DUF1232 family)